MFLKMLDQLGMRTSIKLPRVKINTDITEKKKEKNNNFAKTPSPSILA